MRRTLPARGCCCANRAIAIAGTAQRGNYNWWLAQNDAAPGGRTVVSTYRSRSQLVSAAHYAAYGDDAVRAEIETGQLSSARGAKGGSAAAPIRSTATR